MELTPYVCNKKCYIQHYVNQSGSGLPYFSGSLVQEGYGLGNLLAGVARSVLPILGKTLKPIVKKTAKSLGRKVVKSGADFLQDVVIHKKPVKKSLRKRSSEAMNDIIHASLKSKRKKKNTTKDIFD